MKTQANPAQALSVPVVPLGALLVAFRAVANLIVSVLVATVNDRDKRALLLSLTFDSVNNLESLFFGPPLGLAHISRPLQPMDEDRTD
ncbi:hypothetical protein LguiA_034701 [Lonicera macranthoides]